MCITKMLLVSVTICNYLNYDSLVAAEEHKLTAKAVSRPVLTDHTNPDDV